MLCNMRQLISYRTYQVSLGACFLAGDACLLMVAVILAMQLIYYYCIYHCESL